MTLSLRTDRALIRAAASSTRYVLASYTAPEAPARTERLPVHVALVLDRSGSMAGARKFTLARQAVEQALRMLHADDRFTLVVYDERVDVLVPTTHATADAKRRALDALREVEPRGSTDLCAGWLRGCEQIAVRVEEEGISRALLLTDGLANHGTTDRGTLARHAGELRRRGIATSTFGVGEDFDERLLRDMAHEGGGHFYFIQSPAQIPDYLTSELGEALDVVVRDAALHVALPRGVDAEPLHRFRSALVPDEGGDGRGHLLRVELGDLVSGQDVRVALRVRFPRGEPGERLTLRFSLSGSDLLATHEEALVEWTYADHRENDRQPRDVVVDREVASLYAARARAEAAEANRVGDFERARQVLERTRERIASYANGDRQLLAIVASFDDSFSRSVTHLAMMPLELKSALFAAESTVKNRDASGRARRSER